MTENLAVVGFPKCGTTSLQKYLEDAYDLQKVRRVEIAWLDGGENIKWLNDYILYFIIRNPVDRIWSAYRFFKSLFPKISPEELLEQRIPAGKKVGYYDLIGQSDYQKYIDRYKKYDTVTVKLEDMVEDHMFPHLNKTDDQTKIPQDFKSLVEEKLSKQGISY